MPLKDEISFTIRLPIEITDQIDARREISLRSRNKEIQALIVAALYYQANETRAARSDVRVD